MNDLLTLPTDDGPHTLGLRKVPFHLPSYNLFVHYDNVTVMAFKETTPQVKKACIRTNKSSVLN